ncbi:autotransporter serine protease [Glaciimonas soli]|nr:autotransporter serine protease [Glaciimonas soli]
MNKENTNHFSRTAFALAVSVLVTGCAGGGGGSDGGSHNTGSGGNTLTNTPITPPPPTIVPPGDSGTAPQTPVLPPTSPGAKPPLLNSLDPSNVTAAHAAGITGDNVTIGVVDTDFDLSNPQFGGRVTKTVYSPGGANGNSHGTQVTEMLAGDSTGIAPGVFVQAAASGSNNNGVTLYAQIYTDLFAKGVKIVNQSSVVGTLGSPPSLASSLYTMYTPFVAQQGLFIWATGNDGDKQPALSAAMPHLYSDLEVGWIAVTAVNAVGGKDGFSTIDTVAGEKSSYANSCGVAANWCLAAPGDFVSPSTGQRVYGTSFATPAVTGAAALVQQVYPWMNTDLIRQTILSTATDMHDTATYGWGLLDASKAAKGPALFDKRLTLGSSNFNAIFNDINSEFSNDIAGDAGLLKSGTGSLKLSGKNTFAGLSEIADGTLIITGSVTSGVQIDLQGNLAGDGGHIGGSVANNGTLTNTGKGLTIRGDYTASQFSVFSNDAVSRLTVGGTAHLGNSQLVVTDITDYVTLQPKSSIILTAGAGVNGTFNANPIYAPMLSGTVTYGANDVDLSLQRNDVTIVAAKAFGADATRRNSAANVEQALKVADNMVASGKAGATTSAAFLNSAIALQHSANLESVGVTLDSLSGQIYASSQALTFQQSDAVNRDLSNRMAEFGNSQFVREKTGLWVTALGASGKLSQSGYSTGSTSQWGGQFGADTHLNDKTIVGAAIAYSDSKATFDRFGGEAKSQNVGVSLYGRYALNEQGGYLAGRVGGASVDSKVSRTAIINGDAQGLHAKHDDTVLSGYMESGYKFAVAPNTSVTPFAAISYDHLNRDGFTESGSAFGLTANSQTYHQTAGIAGVRGSSGFQWSAGQSYLQGYTSVQQTFTNGSLDFNASFNGAPDARFSVQGIGLDKTSGWIGVGLTTTVNSTWNWYVNYDAQFDKGGVKNNVVAAGLRMSIQ